MPDTLEPRPNLQVVKEDILITRAGPTSRVGVTVYVNEVRSNLMLSDKLIRLKANDSTSSLFLSISLGNRDAQKQLVSKSSGLAESQTNISQKILLNTKLLLPQFPEQQKIASFLSAVDEKIQQLSKKKALLEQYKKGVMQQLFSGKLRFKDDGGNAYPDWEEKRFGDLYSFHSTNSFSRDKLNYDTGLVYNIHYGDIHTKFKTAFKMNEEYVPFINNNVNLLKIKEDSYCRKGDLVMADASEDYKDIGKTIELIDLEDKNVLAGLHTFLARPLTSKISIGFMGYLLKSWNLRKQIMVIAQGIKVLSLSTTRVGKLKLKLPVIEEQQKTASYLSSIDTKIEQINDQINQTQSFKKGLLQRMFV
ncbi:restriction endonuclease subunit S [Tamlana agarivorans]|uniref:Restriction endonuclease subunit S n=1 Tax=Pseudotamlana agarivorans TaxID=481183 RepID=A0ACC5UAU3_9FLAO|nr:restriction endonuclease subunit S [Tamlana agarivorans]MBU2951416.1 restriction endonuclease subunit S [Tamlana agarivorans]